MGTLIYDNTMRRDPARLAAVKAQIEERQAAFAKAQALIDEAAAVMSALGSVEDDPLVARCVKDIRSTSLHFANDARFIMETPSETYLGNRAAAGSPIGWAPDA